MEGIRERILSIALAAAMVISMVPTQALAMTAQIAANAQETVRPDVPQTEDEATDGGEPEDEAEPAEVITDDGPEDALVDDEGEPEAEPSDDEGEPEDEAVPAEVITDDEPEDEATDDEDEPEAEPSDDEGEPEDEAEPADDEGEPEAEPTEVITDDEPEDTLVDDEDEPEAEPTDDDGELGDEAEPTEAITDDEPEDEAAPSDEDELQPMTIASGTWGTCPWEISDDGVLTIGAGIGSDIGALTKWYPYRDSIVEIKTEFRRMKDGVRTITIPRVILPPYSRSLFGRLENVVTADLRGLDTSNATNLKEMLAGCHSLTTVFGLEGFKTSKVTDMSYMFSGCQSLTSLNVSQLDTSNVTDMSKMFFNCASLTSLDVSTFGTSKVTNMYGMFQRCSSLSVLDLSSFDTSNTTDMSFMFAECSSLSSLDLSTFDTSSANDLQRMFMGCFSLAKVKVGKGFKWDGDGSTGCSLPNHEVNGHSDWWSTKDKAWFTNTQIASSRSGVADTYTKVATTQSIAGATVGAVGNKTYTGSEIKPSPTVKMGSKTLKKGTDYTLSYANNVNVGTATITVKGKGSYTGTKKATFKIVPKSISDATVASVGNKTYTGSAIKPTPAVKMGSKTLKKGTDYTLSWSANVNVGTATITVKGKGNYTGTKKVTFKIVPASISKASVSAIPDQVYTGVQIRPTPTVKVGGKTLKKGTDYTLSYKDAVNVGTAIVTVKGKGNYKDSCVATFRIAFRDVPKSHQFYEKIHLAAEAGLIAGYGGDRTGDFGPSDDITRAQFAVILWRMAGEKTAGAGAKDFPDVEKDAYYYKAVRWASSVGVVNGYDNGYFGPYDKITRQQLAVMVANYARSVGGVKVSGSEKDYASLPDAASVGAYARASVGWCYKNGIFVLQSGKLNPTKKADRATAAQMAYDLFDLIS